MKIQDIAEIKWEAEEEWREKWYNQELEFLGFKENGNPLAKLFTTHGLNCISLNTRWYFDKADLQWDEDRKNVVKRGTHLFEKLINNTEEYIRKVKKTIAYIEKVKSINTREITEIRHAFLLLWYIFLSDLGKPLTPYVNYKFSKKGLTVKQIDVLIDYCFNFKHPFGYQEEEKNLRMIYSKLVTYNQTEIDRENISSDVKELIQKHWEKFRYLSCFELDKEPYSTTDILNSLKIVGKRKEIRRRRKIPFSIEKELTQDDLRFLYLIHRHIFLDNYAADLYAKLDFLLCGFLTKKYSLSFRELSWYSFGELKKLVKKGKKLTPNELKIRKKYRVMTHIRGNIKMYYGKETYALIKNIVGRIKAKKPYEFKGLIASRGFTRNTVKIIRNAQDIKKLKTGEILVAPSTHPDLMTAIIRCSGIITDVGGITSHAAVISRELNIPCLVGTSIATQVLKDGDIVELDANKGVVKIINA